jgi:hypothetical protein
MRDVRFGFFVVALILVATAVFAGGLREYRRQPGEPSGQWVEIERFSVDGREVLVEALRSDWLEKYRIMARAIEHKEEALGSKVARTGPGKKDLEEIEGLGDPFINLDIYAVPMGSERRRVAIGRIRAIVRVSFRTRRPDLYFWDPRKGLWVPIEIAAKYQNAIRGLRVQGYVRDRSTHRVIVDAWPIDDMEADDS